MKKFETLDYYRVNKTMAKKAYKLGFDVIMLPNLLNPQTFNGNMAYHVENKYYNDPYVFEDISDLQAWEYCDKQAGTEIYYYLKKYTHIHLSFNDGSNPFVFYGSTNECILEIKKWYKNYNVTICGNCEFYLIEKSKTEA